MAIRNYFFACLRVKGNQGYTRRSKKCERLWTQCLRCFPVFVPPLCSVSADYVNVRHYTFQHCSGRVSLRVCVKVQLFKLTVLRCFKRNNTGCAQFQVGVMKNPKSRAFFNTIFGYQRSGQGLSRAFQSNSWPGPSRRKNPYPERPNGPARALATTLQNFHESHWTQPGTRRDVAINFSLDYVQLDSVGLKSLNTPPQLQPWSLFTINPWTV